MYDRRLDHPKTAVIPRLEDSLSYLYLERAAITQTKTAIIAKQKTNSSTKDITIPVASLAALLLGPGTSITHQAATTITRNQCVILNVGDSGIRTYTVCNPIGGTAEWAQTQACVYADITQRTEAVRRMFSLRFGSDVDTTKMTIKQMMGAEGYRMKQIYKKYAQEHGIASFMRSYNPEDYASGTSINRALTSGNQCLYGIVTAAIAIMRCSPHLGFLHTGLPNSFVWDIADIYKTEIVIPLAFQLHNDPHPDKTMRLRFREDSSLLKLLSRIIPDIKYVLTGKTNRHTDVEAEPALWDGTTNVTGGINHSWDEI